MQFEKYHRLESRHDVLIDKALEYFNPKTAVGTLLVSRIKNVLYICKGFF